MSDSSPLETTSSPCPTCGEPRTLAGKTKIQWKCKPCANAYARARYEADPDEIRRRKRESMARVRQTEEGKARQAEIAARSYAKVGRDRQRAYYARLRADRFAWSSRQHRARFKVTVAPSELRGLWDAQSGRCALTGQALDVATAHLDHIVPMARGGEHGIDNLRWLHPDVNLAKRDLMDDEFLDLCRMVVEHHR